MSWLSSIFKPPDPGNIQDKSLSFANTLGNTQTQANVGAQASNQYNQSNMYGGTQYVQTGVGPNGMPKYEIQTSGNAQTTPLWNNMFTGQGMAGSQANQLLQGANYGANDPNSTIGDKTSGLTSQMMGSWLQGQQPFMQTSRDQLDTKLKNQGFRPGDGGAYDNAMRQLDANQALGVAQASAQFQPEAFKQATSLYQMPLTMGQQLAGWGAPQDPTKSNVQGPQINPTDYTSAAAIGMKGATDQYAAQAGQYGAMLKGVGDVAGAGLKAYMMSDERVKENKDEVGSLHDGTPVYSYNYIGDETPRIGLMAQDVEKTRPDAVREFGGIKAVDYDKATARSRAMKALLS